jgi:hypothetical protein
LALSASKEYEKGIHYGAATRRLKEMWHELLWVYFMGISTAWLRSGKPGWPTDGDVACGPLSDPVAVNPEG